MTTALIAIYVAALLLKVSGARFMEQVRWWHFLIFPIVFLLLRLLFELLSYAWGFIAVVLVFDVGLWLMEAMMGWGGHTTLFTWQLLTLIANSIWEALFY